MAISVERKQALIGRTIQIVIELVSKDAGDNALIDKFGDIIINVSGSFNDPSDNTFPAFYVNAGKPVPFFKNNIIQTIFEDDILTLPVLQRQATLWGNSIMLQIQNSMTALRALTDSTTMDTTVTI